MDLYTPNALFRANSRDKPSDLNDCNDGIDDESDLFDFEPRTVLPTI